MKSSAATFAPRCRLPRFALRFSQITIVLMDDVVACGLGCFSRGNADDAKRRMLGRVRHLPLECLESVSHDVGFGQAEVGSQPVQLAALTRIEVDLNWLG